MQTTQKEGTTMTETQEPVSLNVKTKLLEEAINFLESQGFQINHVDGIYRVRKEGWGKLPYGLDADTLIKQANIMMKSTKTASSQTEHQESELDRAERRLMETCHKLDAQLVVTMAEVRKATQVIRELKEVVQ